MLWHCWLGDRKGIRSVKNWMLVCWWWWFDWSFARPIAPVVTTTSIILCFSKHRLTQIHLENGHYNEERLSVLILISHLVGGLADKALDFIRWIWVQFSLVPIWVAGIRKGIQPKLLPCTRKVSLHEVMSKPSQEGMLDIKLPFCSCGWQDYSTDNMTENQKRFLQHLREFGLVYQRKVGSLWLRVNSLI